MMRDDTEQLEVAGEEITVEARQGATAVLSSIEFPRILKELELMPALGWRHLVLNLVMVGNEETIAEGARWIYAERLTGAVAGHDPQELLLVAFGVYREGTERAVPQIEGCAALQGGSIELLKAVRFNHGDVTKPVGMSTFEFSSKITHAKSTMGNPVIYRKARKSQDKEAAA